MKNLKYFLFVAVMFFSASCSDEKENIVNPEPEKTAKQGSNKGVNKTDDLICPDPSIRAFHTNGVSTAESYTIEASTVPYYGAWYFHVGNLYSANGNESQMKVYIDGVYNGGHNTFNDDAQVSGGYHLGYGTHVFKLEAKNYCILNSVSVVQKTCYLRVHNPAIPYEPVVSKNTTNRVRPSIQWSAKPNATGYKIYKYKYEEGDIFDDTTPTRVITTTALNYTDNSERLYTGSEFILTYVVYRVTAFSAAGESEFSEDLLFLVD